MMVPEAFKCRMLRLSGATAMLVVMIVLAAAVSVMAGEEEGQREQEVFSSARQAVDAMVAAVTKNDFDGLLAILGPGSEDLVFSGDEVADRNGRQRFLESFEVNNRLEQVEENHMVLIVGSRDYPFPIPIIRRDEGWFFDTPAGIEEILNRRIGRNELHTIEVMQAYTDAQREYACLQPDGASEFARRLTSSEGKKDGLYWKVEEDEAQSPFGPLIARAAEEGYSGGLDEDPPEPFHGYYFKILTAQGDHANGGAFDYVAGGKMVLGFALVAYPARYGVSGIMTFIVNQEGVIYEKDLGENTDAAAAMTAFDPDETWIMYREDEAQ
ncbi:MAG: DUF2950 domain-containing protein [Desulfobulbaceae bacterium]|nr:DUF2950 domain-containing protein [Desulfobulbaceae bacterium]